VNTSVEVHVEVVYAWSIYDEMLTNSPLNSAWNVQAAAQHGYSGCRSCCTLRSDERWLSSKGVTNGHERHSKALGGCTKAEQLGVAALMMSSVTYQRCNTTTTNGLFDEVLLFARYAAHLCTVPRSCSPCRKRDIPKQVKSYLQRDGALLQGVHMIYTAAVESTG